VEYKQNSEQISILNVIITIHSISLCLMRMMITQPRLGYFVNSAVIRILECCPMLQNLELRCRIITDIAIIRIGERCPTLQNLHLVVSSSITDISIVRVGDCCPKLKTLRLQCNVTNIGIFRIAEGCPMLKTFSLNGRAFTDISII
jgi:hypothetical protein